MTPVIGGGARESVRVEMFSDGVFAIAVTLLSLGLKVPQVPGARLGEALRQEWPGFLAFVTSFMTVGIIWINHHRLFTQIRRIDHGLLLLNGILLMAVALVPFANALMTEYLGRAGQNLAAMAYDTTFAALAMSFNLVWAHAKRHGLLEGDVDPSVVHRASRQYGVAPLLYLMSFGLARFSAVASIVADVALVAFFALPSFAWDRIEMRRIHGERGPAAPTSTVKAIASTRSRV